MFNVLCKLTNETIGKLEVDSFNSDELIGFAKPIEEDDWTSQVIKMSEGLVFKTPLQEEKVFPGRYLLIQSPDGKKYKADVISVSGNKMILKVNIYSDKRKYLRVRIDKEMDVKVVLGQKIQKTYALIDNLSYGGMGFLTDRELPVGTHVILKLNLQKTISFEGIVRHAKEDEDGLDFYHGVEFIDFSKRKGNILFTYLDKLVS